MYDQMAALYTNFMVLGSKITVKIGNIGSDTTTSSNRIWVLRWVPKDTAPLSGWPRLYEQQNTLIKFSPDSERSPSVITFKKFVKTRQVFNSPLRDKEHEFGAAFGFDPDDTYRWNWEIYGFPWGMYTAGDAISLPILVKITFYTRLWERKQPIAS